ncbi:hypothetical protein BDV18DRAFT_156499 [Aspergillus unguis]
MASISDNWPGMQNIDADSDHARRIQSVLESANWNYLSGKAVELRQAHTQEALTCSIDTTKFASGFNNVVVALTFSDSVQWIARVALPQEEESDKSEARQSLLSEVATLNLIRAKTKVPVAQVFDYGLPTKDF